MLRIEILNDGTGTDESANYTYRVFVNNGVIAEGKVAKLPRREGWEVLAKKVVEDAERQKQVAALIAFSKFCATKEALTQGAE